MELKYHIAKDNQECRELFSRYRNLETWKKPIHYRLKMERENVRGQEWYIRHLEHNLTLKEDEVVMICIEKMVPCTDPEDIEMWGEKRGVFVLNMFANESELETLDLEYYLTKEE